MSGKEKACLNCRRIFTESVCPNCGETTFSENFKGKVNIFKSDESEISRNMKIKNDGEFAVKSK